jgi:hypothetical protein
MSGNCPANRDPEHNRSDERKRDTHVDTAPAAIESEAD